MTTSTLHRQQQSRRQRRRRRHQEEKKMLAKKEETTTAMAMTTMAQVRAPTALHRRPSHLLYTTAPAAATRQHCLSSLPRPHINSLFFFSLCCLFSRLEAPPADGGEKVQGSSREGKSARRLRDLSAFLPLLLMSQAHRRQGGVC